MRALSNSFTKGLTCFANLNRVASKQMVVSSFNENARTSFTRCSCSFLVAIIHCQVYLAGGCPAGDSSKSGDASCILSGHNQTAPSTVPFDSYPKLPLL